MRTHGFRTSTPALHRTAVIGGGPAGLMAAEVLACAGVDVTVFDAMPSVGRKFLLAGRGGLNLTHSEPFHHFVSRYGAATHNLYPILSAFGPAEVREWTSGLGIETFVGTSNRVFPVEMKATPLLRSWIHRLQTPGHGLQPVRFAPRHRWRGWSSPCESGRSEAQGQVHDLVFDTPQGCVRDSFHSVVLGLGGGSWPRLGSDGAWVPWLVDQGVNVQPLQPSNCGFDLLKGSWSEHFSMRYAGQPFKSVAVRVRTLQGDWYRLGEFVATATGVEGSLVYAASALIREHLSVQGFAEFELDLLPQWTYNQVLARLQITRGRRSMSSHLKHALGLDGIKTAVLYEFLGKEKMNQPEQLAAAVKGLSIRLGAARPIEEAISSAGGVAWNSLDPDLMLHAVPGAYCVGEMIDWDAPTGGYLLTACLATGHWVGHAILNKMGGQPVLTHPSLDRIGVNE